MQKSSRTLGWPHQRVAGGQQQRTLHSAAYARQLWGFVAELGPAQAGTSLKSSPPAQCIASTAALSATGIVLGHAKPLCREKFKFLRQPAIQKDETFLLAFSHSIIMKFRRYAPEACRGFAEHRLCRVSAPPGRKQALFVAFSS